jgi:hypothetical protein
MTIGPGGVAKERPIIFSGDMVRVILADRKTQTRRVVREYIIKGPNPPGNVWDWYNRKGEWIGACINKAGNALELCPYGQPGDRLWVRETYTYYDGPIYRADPGNEVVTKIWNSPLYMPRSISRIDLEITNVRIERVQDISEEDAKAEGPPLPVELYQMGIKGYGEWFSMKWDLLNSKRGYGWDVNPWVWVIKFKRCDSGPGPSMKEEK